MAETRNTDCKINFSNDSPIPQKNAYRGWRGVVMKSVQYHAIVQSVKAYKRFKISQHRNFSGSYEDKIALIKMHSQGLWNYLHKSKHLIGYIDITLKEGRFQQLEELLGLK
jgi:hypothetical protein